MMEACKMIFRRIRKKQKPDQHNNPPNTGNSCDNIYLPTGSTANEWDKFLMFMKFLTLSVAEYGD